jgi:hypothetical protein
VLQEAQQGIAVPGVEVVGRLVGEQDAGRRSVIVGAKWSP